MNRKLPFQNLGLQSRLNLALFAVFIYYLMQFGLALYANNLFNTIGSDFLSFWSVGHIANNQGYAHVYDLSLLSKVQKPFHEDIVTDRIYAPIPAPLFAIFITPFQFLSLLDPAMGFFLWTIINLFGLIVYLRFFIKDMIPGPIQPRLLVIFLISLPVFQTLFWGQINVWLVICLGEFMRAAFHEKSYRSGLWLAGLLIKPQTLVLLIPALLLQRSWKKLAGFITMAIGIITVSIALAGLQGIYSLVELWLNYVSGIPTNAPENMVNWRMVALQISPFTGTTIGWGVAFAGLIITMLMCFLLWLKPVSPSSPRFSIALLGTLAATMAVTWHSHLHMMMIILPPLVYLAAQDRISLKLIYYWAFAPPVIAFIVFILGVFVKLGLLPAFGYQGLFLGLCGLTLHLSLLAWSMRELRGTS